MACHHYIPALVNLLAAGIMMIMMVMYKGNVYRKVTITQLLVAFIVTKTEHYTRFLKFSATAEIFIARQHTDADARY